MPSPLRVGLNPYGLTYTLGLQGAGTPRANPAAGGLDAFIAIAREIGAACIEIDHRWLAPLDTRSLERLRARLDGMTPICSFWLTHTPDETLAEAVRCATGIGASLVRLHLTPVLEGARAALGPRWCTLVDHARATLVREAARAAAAGLQLGLEDHQDLGSEELVAIAEAAGENVGVVFDTGNPFAVGEDPVAFARRVAPRLLHLHLKDYRAQFTLDGYRLVRCAIGEGAVPLEEIVAVLGARERALTASIEPGALEARHVRLFTAGWWCGYPTRDASELGTALGRLRPTRIEEIDDARTPWERGSDTEIVEYERAHLARSVRFLRHLGWMEEMT